MWEPCAILPVLPAYISCVFVQFTVLGFIAKKRERNNHPTTALSRETNLWLTGRNIAITARKKKAPLKTLNIFIYTYVITSDFFDTRYAMHSVHIAAALTMNFSLLNPFEHEQTVPLTKAKSRKQISPGFPQLNHSILSHAGAMSVFVYLWIPFRLLQLTQAPGTPSC